MQSNHLDTTLVSNAVESILDFEAKELIKTNSKAKLTLITNYAKPILAQVIAFSLFVVFIILNNLKIIVDTTYQINRAASSKTSSR